MGTDRFESFSRALASAPYSRRRTIGIVGALFAGAVSHSIFGARPASAQSCSSDSDCDGGTCLFFECVYGSECSFGQTDCDGSCVYTFSDRDNCGYCYNHCSSGVCSGGFCTSPCSGTYCGEDCVTPRAPLQLWVLRQRLSLRSVRRRHLHRGVFGDVLRRRLHVHYHRPVQLRVVRQRLSVWCVFGAVSARRRVMGTMCSGTCVYTNSDANNCGSCGNVCPSGVCSGGVCTSTCDGTMCSGTCVYTNSDANNCGSVRQRLPVPTVRVFGRCLYFDLQRHDVQRNLCGHLQRPVQLRWLRQRLHPWPDLTRARWARAATASVRRREKAQNQRCESMRI